MGYSKNHLSGPLMEKMKVAVHYSSANNLDTAGISLRKRLPQIFFASQTRSIQTQTDLNTNVTIERFNRILKGNIGGEYSKTLDIILSGYGRLEIDSNTLFINS